MQRTNFPLGINKSVYLFYLFIHGVSLHGENLHGESSWWASSLWESSLWVFMVNLHGESLHGESSWWESSWWVFIVRVFIVRVFIERVFIVRVFIVSLHRESLHRESFHRESLKAWTSVSTSSVWFLPPGVQQRKRWNPVQVLVVYMCSPEPSGDPPLVALWPLALLLKRTSDPVCLGVKVPSDRWVNDLPVIIQVETHRRS